jgi:manganese efflux pump family protein
VTAVLLVAVSVGLDNFAVSAAFGMTGAGGRRRLEVALVFGLFAGLMPLLGLALGARLSGVLGSAAEPVAACVLGLTGLAGLVSAVRERRSGSSAGPAADRKPVPGAASARLWLTAVVLSLDSLVVGLALGAYRVPLLVAVATFAVVGVGMSLLGVEIGRRVSAALGELGGMVGSVALIGVGVALGLGVL